MSGDAGAAQAFDPYLKWLGIAPKDQPPHHYRLLGIDPFTDDADVIDNAAEGRMRHVRTFSGGQHAALSQRLLNEIAAAHVCLLNPQAKAAYDQQLRARLQPPASPASPVPQPSLRTRPAEPSAGPTQGVRPVPVASEAVPIVTSDYGRGRHARKKSFPWPAAAAAMAGAAFLAVVLVIVLREKPDALTDASGAGQSADGYANGATPETPAGGGSDNTYRGATYGKRPASEAAETPNDSGTADTTPAETTLPNETSGALEESTAGGFTADPPDNTEDAPVGPSPVPAIDLLTDVDIQRDTVHGQWQRTPRGLVSEERGQAVRLAFPVEVPTEFSLSLDVERLSGNNMLFVGIPWERRHLELVVDYRQGPFVTGIVQQDKKWPVMRRDLSLPVGSVHALSVRVTGESIVVVLDGETLAEYRAPYDNLEIFPNWTIPRPRTIAIGGFESSFRFSRAELRPITARLADVDPTTLVTGVATGETPGGFAPELPTSSDPSADRRLPVPEDEAQRAAAALVQEVFGDEIRAAKTPEEKVTLSEKLRRQADETRDDPTARYVLLLQARDLAAEAGSPAAVMRAVDRLAFSYQVDKLDEGVAALVGISKNVRKSDDHKAMLVAIDGLLADLVKEDRYDDARNLARLAQSSSVASQDIELRKQVAAGIRKLGTLQAAYAKVQEAEMKLADDPDDAAAHLAVGKYHALGKGRWDRGLPHLAQGSDAALRAAAEQDLAGASSVADSIKLADAWWDAAQSAAGDDRVALLLRAGSWYSRGAFDLGGLEKVRVDRRLEEIRKLARIEPIRSAGAKKGSRLTSGFNPAEWRVARRGEGGRWELFPLDAKVSNFAAGEATFRHPGDVSSVVLIVFVGTDVTGDVRISVEVSGNLLNIGCLRATGEDRSRHVSNVSHDDTWKSFTLERTGGQFKATSSGMALDVMSNLASQEEAQPLRFYIGMIPGQQFRLRNFAFEELPDAGAKSGSLPDADASSDDLSKDGIAPAEWRLGRRQRDGQPELLPLDGEVSSFAGGMLTFRHAGRVTGSQALVFAGAEATGDVRVSGEVSGTLLELGVRVAGDSAQRQFVPALSASDTWKRFTFERVGGRFTATRDGAPQAVRSQSWRDDKEPLQFYISVFPNQGFRLRNFKFEELPDGGAR